MLTRINLSSSFAFFNVSSFSTHTNRQDCAHAGASKGLVSSIRSLVNSCSHFFWIVSDRRLYYIAKTVRIVMVVIIPGREVDIRVQLE